ncbi:18176_t:CDS:2 [Funneliformis geosporum]|uniref:12593_t:CDS:1 n=1 Tax=Funneliformis geosporum TaxID=1117311 RepID=A0A9W4SGV8_9GLOM|nr:12593_t:CDS:2 [Funneliformis geosporum]CAI2168832.1 18176_t:CDS:2 [Funneliformis geosporum]
MSTQNFNDKTIVTKSKRGRKALAVSEGHIDTTGRTHIMTVRRSNPPTSKRKSSKAPNAIKPSNNYCSRCEQKDNYIDVLNDRIGKLENAVNILTNETKQNNNQENPQPLSTIRTEENFNLFNQNSTELFERQNQTQLQVQMETPITTSTPDIGVPYQFVDSAIPLPYIGLEVPFQYQIQLQTQYNIITNMITQIQTQMEAPNSTLSLSYELEDPADWSHLPNNTDNYDNNKS